MMIKVAINSLRFVVPLMCLMLLSRSSSVASSFTPGSTRNVLISRRTNSMMMKYALSVKGGSDEESQTPPPESEPSTTIVPPTSPPAPPPPPQPMEMTQETPAEVEPVQQDTTSASSSTGTNTMSSQLGPNAPPPGFLRKTIPSFPWHRLPNFLTYVRCIAIPALMVIFYLPDCHILTGSIFAVASFTDWLDGYLARRWDITSAFGAFLDPVADKLMVSTSLILLAGRYGREIALPTAIILAREIAVSALREWMATRGERDAVKVGFQGKVKTALTMVALTVLLFVPATEGTGILSTIYMPGLVMLYLCTLVTITSGSVYFIAAGPLLFNK